MLINFVFFNIVTNLSTITDFLSLHVEYNFMYFSFNHFTNKLIENSLHLSTPIFLGFLFTVSKSINNSNSLFVF